MSPLIWIQPAHIGGLFFVLRFLPPCKASCQRSMGGRPYSGICAYQNLYETARNEMIGSAFSSALLTASSVPSAALTITDEVVFSGI